MLLTNTLPLYISILKTIRMKEKVNHIVSDNKVVLATLDYDKLVYKQRLQYITMYIKPYLNYRLEGNYNIKYLD